MIVASTPYTALLRVLLLSMFLLPFFGREAGAETCTVQRHEIFTIASDAAALPPAGHVPTLHARREDLFSRGASASCLHVAVFPQALRLPPLPPTPVPAEADIPVQRDVELRATPSRAPPLVGTHH